MTNTVKKWKIQYLQRGYPIKLVDDGRKRAREVDRKTLLNPDHAKHIGNDEDKVIPLILTYHPSNKLIHDIIMKNWGILSYSDKCKAALP